MVFGSSFAQSELSLSDAISRALENNYDLKVIRNTEKVASVNNTWGNTGFLPTVTFSASANESYHLNDDEEYRDQTIMPNVSLNWVIFNGFSARISKARYEQLEEQSEGNTSVLVENTIQDVILAYNNCLLQRKLMEVYEEVAQLSEDRYSRSENSKAIGASTTYESLQAKTSWLEDQSNYLQQKVSYENAIRTLNYAMAESANETWSFSSEISIDTVDYNYSDLFDKMTSNNKTLRNQYVSQSLQANQVQQAKSSYYPSLSLSAGINNTDYLRDYSGSKANVESNYINPSIGLTLSWNIFNGGTNRRSVQIAKIEEESSQIETDQMLHSLENKLAQMYSTYNVNKAILELTKEQVAAAKLNMDMSKEKLDNGSINSFNYRDVQIAYTDAVISRLKAVYNLLESHTDLLSITGAIIDEYE